MRNIYTILILWAVAMIYTFCAFIGGGYLISILLHTNMVVGCVIAALFFILSFLVILFIDEFNVK